MTSQSEPMPADLAALRQEFPTWRFGTIWGSADDGPNPRRRLTASRDGILLSAWTAAERVWRLAPVGCGGSGGLGTKAEHVLGGWLERTDV